MPIRFWLSGNIPRQYSTVNKSSAFFFFPSNKIVINFHCNTALSSSVVWIKCLFSFSERRIRIGKNLKNNKMDCFVTVLNNYGCYDNWSAQEEHVWTFPQCVFTMTSFLTIRQSFLLEKGMKRNSSAVALFKDQKRKTFEGLYA